MLRTLLFSARARALGPLAPCPRLQWLGARSQRHFADARKADVNTKSSISDSQPAVLPGSASTTASTSTPPPPGPVKPVSPASNLSTPSSPPTPASSSTIPPENVPLTPPPPPPGPKVQTSPPVSSPKGPTGSAPPPPPPPPPPPQSPSVPPPPASPRPPLRRPRRFRNFLLTMILLTGLGYGGAVYYALVSDNFHDFFTEYVPLGEEAVAYFEERDFRRRFPHAANRALGRQRDTGNRVTIPKQSGISWKVAQGEGSPPSDGQRKDARSSGGSGGAEQHPSDATLPEKSATVEKAKEKAPTPSSSSSSSSSKNDQKPKLESSHKEPKQGPKQEPKEPKPKAEEAKKKLPKAAPLPAIDPLNIKDAEEPLVQDLVKIVNNIITVVNADNSGGKFSSALDSAKTELTKVGARIMALKQAEQKTAEEKIKSSHEDFDKAAKELVRRLEEEMRDQEARWKDEFESEREKISQSYQTKLKTELDRAKEVSDQRLRNELLEQAIGMKRKYTTDVKDLVEQERNGRLSKLSELSSSVTELEKLTSDWSSVVDANLKTQHLHVAVDAVRASLESPAQPRPFIRELAALKDIAADDAVVDAVIASLDPVTYQRGVPTSAQLIDRFRRVASEVRKAALLPEDAGVASHAASVLLSKVLFKKNGLAVGDDVESVLTRSETLLEEGDLDGAAREMNGLTGWAKTLSVDWLGEVRRVLELQQALDVVTTEARLQSLRVE